MSIQTTRKEIYRTIAGVAALIALSLPLGLLGLRVLSFLLGKIPT
jgi:hypothetical protein